MSYKSAMKANQNLLKWARSHLLKAHGRSDVAKVDAAEDADSETMSDAAHDGSDEHADAHGEHLMADEDPDSCAKDPAECDDDFKELIVRVPKAPVIAQSKAPPPPAKRGPGRPKKVA